MTADALDITIFVILLLSGLMAYFRGIIQEAFTLLAVIMATTITWQGGGLMIPAFEKWFRVSPEADPEEPRRIMGLLKPEMAAKVSAFGSTFLVTFIVMTLIGFFVRRTVTEMGLGKLDKMLGGAFGVLRGFLLVFLIYVPCTVLIEEEKFPKWAKDSRSVPVLEATFAWADKEFKIKEHLEHQGDNVAIRVEKVDPDKIGEETPETEGANEPEPAAGAQETMDEEQQLQEELKREETERNSRAAAPVFDRLHDR